MKLYEIISNLDLECPSDKIAKKIIDDLTYSLVDIVEKYDCFVGGGFDFKELDKDGNK